MYKLTDVLRARAEIAPIIKVNKLAQKIEVAKFWASREKEAA